MAYPISTPARPATTPPRLARPRASGQDAEEQERQLLALAGRGSYRVMDLVGRGGMSAVYLAWEYALERYVAIKLLSPALRLNLEDRERFRREARIGASLSHPNIVPVYTYGEVSGLPFFVMPYVRGETLAERLERVGRVPVVGACSMLADLADALDCAHRRGVLHRDVKPGNILLDSDTGRPMLTDFGVATVSTSEHSRSEMRKALGTPNYMAPEQALGDHQFDGRGDIYSLGVVAFQMLAGRLPFVGVTSAEIVAQHVGREAPPLAQVAPDVPAPVAAVIDRCLRKDPRRRWPDGAALRDALFAAGVRADGARSRGRRLMDFAANLLG